MFCTFPIVFVSRGKCYFFYLPLDFQKSDFKNNKCLAWYQWSKLKVWSSRTKKKDLSDFEIYGGIGCRGEIFLVPILFQKKYTSIIRVFLEVFIFLKNYNQSLDDNFVCVNWSTHPLFLKFLKSVWLKTILSQMFCYSVF